MASSAVSGELVHAEKQEEVEADFLRLVPDLVVVEVLKNLDTASLLACRLLSRRMEELVRLPQVWAHRRVVSDTDLRAALLLAVPCVEELHVDFHRSAEVDAMLPHMNCVAEKLFLSVYENFTGNTNTGLIVTVLRNQAESGRLKELTVRFERWNGDAAVFCELARIIVSASTSLKFLEVEIEFCEGDVRYPIDELRSCCDLNFAPGLKTLRYYMVPFSSREDLDPLLEKLLAAHAATLEDVLLNFTPFSCAMTFPNLIYPRLKILKCPMMKGMETALPGLIALKELHLDHGNHSEYSTRTKLLTTEIARLTMPLLSDLHIRSPASFEWTCAHVWLHQISVQGMLSRNPKLRLHVDELYSKCRTRTLYSSDGYCQFCRAGCHNLDGFYNSFTWMDF